MKKEEEIERLKQALQEEKENINALMKKNSKIENNINETNENKINEFERKYSWNESNNNGNDEKKSSGKKIKTTINEDDERERELMLEIGKSRSNRAMTVQKSSYNFGEVILNLRQRRERLAIFNKKFIRESLKIK